MAINISREPSGIYPAYNDSYIVFSSTLVDNNKAKVKVYPIETFPNEFELYPDLQGNYIFNLKESVKVNFNENGFNDYNYFTDSYYKNITGLFLSQQIDIEVFNDLTSESISKTYSFYKGVKQIGQSIFANEFQLLSHSKDGVNFALTYFEGFPFNFDIQKAVAGHNLKIKSLNSGIITANMEVTLSDAFRINVDLGGGNNWTSEAFLPLNTGLNKLELYSNDVFKTNILITKKKICSGIYLKWVNSQGGFSHYLFEEFYTEKTAGKDIDFILKSEFLNINEMRGDFASLGKNSGSELVVKCKYPPEDYENLKDIFSAASIQMYTSKEAYVEGVFIDVNIKGNMNFSNKRLINNMVLTVELPNITANL